MIRRRWRCDTWHTCYIGNRLWISSKSIKPAFGYYPPTVSIWRRFDQIRWHPNTFRLKKAHHIPPTIAFITVSNLVYFFFLLRASSYILACGWEKSFQYLYYLNVIIDQISIETRIISHCQQFTNGNYIRAIGICALLIYTPIAFSIYFLFLAVTLRCASSVE